MNDIIIIKNNSLRIPDILTSFEDPGKEEVLEDADKPDLLVTGKTK